MKSQIVLSGLAAAVAAALLLSGALAPRGQAAPRAGGAAVARVAIVAEGARANLLELVRDWRRGAEREGL
jgi:hypothetical protein